MASIRDMLDLLTHPQVEENDVLSEKERMFVLETRSFVLADPNSLPFDRISELERVYDKHKREIWNLI